MTTNWNDHPVVLLGGAFMAGVVAALTVAMPIYTTQQQNAFDDKVRQVENRYEQDKAGIAKVADLRAQNSFLRRQMVSARIELWQLTDKKPFRSASPVPVGLEAVTKGQSLDGILSLFRGAKIVRSGTYVYVTLTGGLIQELQLDTADGKILNVTYYVEDSASSRLRLLTAVTATFGNPQSMNVGDHGERVYRWTVGGKDVLVNGSQYSVL